MAGKLLVVVQSNFDAQIAIAVEVDGSIGTLERVGWWVECPKSIAPAPAGTINVCAAFDSVLTGKLYAIAVGSADNQFGTFKLTWSLS